MKICIATPMYGGMCTSIYTHAMLDLQQELLKKGYEVYFNYLYNESLITRARNKLVHNFLKSDSEVLLFVDADHGFDVDTVIRLIESPEDIIGAIAPMKGIQWKTVLLAHEKGLTDYERFSGIYAMNTVEEVDPLTFDENKPLEMIHIGTGMMKINRRVFEELAPHCERYINSDALKGPNMSDPIIEYFKTSINDEGILLSEDYEFCRKWKMLGNKVYGAPWVYLTHAGHYVFSGSYSNTIALLATQ